MCFEYFSIASLFETIRTVFLSITKSKGADSFITKPFNKETVDFLLELAEKGIKELFVAQKAVIDAARRR